MVLILVLVEHTLGVAEDFIFVSTVAVLILVLVEHTLGVHISQVYVQLAQS